MEIQFSDLPAFIRLRIFSSLAAVDLLSAVQCCKQWRIILTNEIFLNNYCRRKFDLTFRELPEVSPWHIIFINIQRLMFQKTHIVDVDDADISLMKIFMHQLRFGSVVHYLLLYPRHYVIGDRQTLFCSSPIEGDPMRCYGQIGDVHLIPKEPLDQFIPRFLSRIHAAFPLLFDNEFLQPSRWCQLFDNTLDWRFDQRRADQEVWSCCFNRMIHEVVVNDDRCPIAGFEIRTHDGDHGPTLCFAFYDDCSWRVAYLPPLSYVSLATAASCDCTIHSDATLEEIRRYAGAIMNKFFEKADSSWAHCLKNGLTMIKPNPFYDFLKSLVAGLDSAITSVAERLSKKLRIDHSRGRKLIKFLDEKWPCDSLEHQNCARRVTSPILRVALARALRRLVNTVYVPEVQQLYFGPCDDKTFHFMHQLMRSPPGCGGWESCKKWMNKGMDVQGKCAKKKCGIKQALRNACCHKAFPELWPAHILSKAIGDLPRLAAELQRTVECFISNGFLAKVEDERYFCSLGKSLEMLEARCINH